MDGLYLFHFARPYQHARHYLGFAKDVDRRVNEHLMLTVRCSPLVRAALRDGIDVELVRTWPKGTRTLERRLKRQGGLSRHCPVCRETGVFHR